MEVAHIDAFHRDTAGFWEYYRPRFETLGEKRPNPAHQALAELERRGLLAGVVTQNIDRLHRGRGIRAVVEVHGSIATSSCTTCGASYALEAVEALFDEDGIATCGCCMGKVKPDVVLFGEHLPEAAMAEAQELCAGAELLLCVGSSLEVYPVAGLPELTLDAGGRSRSSPRARRRTTTGQRCASTATWSPSWTPCWAAAGGLGLGPQRSPPCQGLGPQRSPRPGWAGGGYRRWRVCRYAGLTRQSRRGRLPGRRALPRQDPPAPQHAVAQRERLGDLGAALGGQLARDRLVGGLAGDRAAVTQRLEVLDLARGLVGGELGRGAAAAGAAWASPPPAAPRARPAAEAPPLASARPRGRRARAAAASRRRQVPRGGQARRPSAPAGAGPRCGPAAPGAGGTSTASVQRPSASSSPVP